MKEIQIKIRYIVLENYITKKIFLKETLKNQIFDLKYFKKWNEIKNKCSKLS